MEENNTFLAVKLEERSPEEFSSKYYVHFSRNVLFKSFWFSFETIRDIHEFNRLNSICLNTG